jgi:hypothetical protein
MFQARLKRLAICAAPLLFLSACGGGSGTATIGGTVTGLVSGLSVTLQNNGADNISYTGNGSTSFTFIFPTGVGSGSGYNATVLTQPLGETCTVTNGSGTVDSSADSVSNIAVACAVTSSVVGTVAGLNSGVAVTLLSNGTQLLTGNGSFSFAGLLATGSTYNVTVATQPAGQSCTIANSTGTVVANTSAVVTVTCR